ncbi:MAG: heme A synthase [Actinomycetota bacterium]
MSNTRRLALVAAGATFALISIGGLVRATKSGLGCGTDWPHCSGRLLPALENRAVLIEFSHRLAAGVVILLLGWLAVRALRRHRSEPQILWGSVAAFVLVLSQAALGALVVKLELQAVSVALHLLVALSLLGLLLWVAFHASEESSFRRPDRSIHRRSLLAAAAVAAAMLSGSYVTGSDAGLAFPDWPLMGGQLLPDLSLRHAAIAFLHRLLVVLGGIAVLAAVGALVRVRVDSPNLARLGYAAGGLYGGEILIGALNVWTQLNPLNVTLHLALGAAIWGCLLSAAVGTRAQESLVGTRGKERRAVVEAPA